MLRTNTLIFLLFQLISCTTVTEEKTIAVKKEFNEKQIEEEVKKTLNNYQDDIRSSGFMAELKYLDSSEDFFWTPPGYSHSISYDSVVKVLEYNAPRFKKVDNRFETLKIVVLSEKIATFSAKLKSSVTDTAGNEMNYKLVETGVLIKRKDGWKLINGHTSVVIEN